MGFLQPDRRPGESVLDAASRLYTVTGKESGNQNQELAFRLLAAAALPFVAAILAHPFMPPGHPLWPYVTILAFILGWVLALLEQDERNPGEQTEVPRGPSDTFWWPLAVALIPMVAAGGLTAYLGINGSKGVEPTSVTFPTDTVFPTADTTITIDVADPATTSTAAVETTTPDQTIITPTTTTAPASKDQTDATAAAVEAVQNWQAGIPIPQSSPSLETPATVYPTTPYMSTTAVAVPGGWDVVITLADSPQGCTLPTCPTIDVLVGPAFGGGWQINQMIDITGN